MTSIKKFGFIAAAAACFAFVASSSAMAQESITIWTNGDKAHKGLAELGKKFTADTGIKVIVEHPDDAPGKFQTAAASGKGPDVIQWAHDRMGEWAVGGLLHPIKPKFKLKKALAKKGWDAFTIKGQVWGIPLSFESVALVCNKKLAPRAPRTFKAVKALHKKLSAEGKKAIAWDINNTYFTMGLLHAHGGYAFKRNPNGTYNEKNIGVNNKGAVKGLETLLDLIEAGVIAKGTKYSDMESGVLKGTTACMITGPWAWANLKKNSIEFSVSPLPSIAGKASKPFVGVQGFMVSSASKNKQAAVKFIEEYVMNPNGLETLDNDVPLGVAAHGLFYRKNLAKDPHIRATFANVKVGILMPNNPKMGAFWAAMGPALENATNGRQSAKEALDGAYKRINAP